MMKDSPDLLLNAVVYEENTREWEMGKHQRGLVDNSFEEGQYGSALEMLEQLRSFTHRPSVCHIRQLIYIALHPAHGQSFDDKVTLLDSPSKIVKQQRSTFSLQPAAVVLARQLLMSFIQTNIPEAVGGALPHFSDTGNQSVTEDCGDSYIAKQSLCITEAKSCWSLFDEGFNLRKRVFASPKRKGRRRDLSWDEDLLLGQINSQKERAIVGVNAWPVLDCLLTLFERDETFAVSQGLPRHSPLLLKQIPPPRGKSGQRWDTAVPVAVVFFCFQQNDLRRRRMGNRLLTLLINLSSTAYLDLPMFVGSIFSRLSASDSDDFSMLFSDLVPSPSVYKFKIALCQKMINHNVPASIARPKPQARAQPRARHSTHDLDRLPHAPSEKINDVHLSYPSKHHLPSCSDVIKLMEVDKTGTLFPPAARAHLLRAKFELYISYGLLQAQLCPEEIDAEWKLLLRDKKLETVIDVAFGNENRDDATMYQGLLRSITSLW